MTMAKGLSIIAFTWLLPLFAIASDDTESVFDERPDIAEMLKTNPKDMIDTRRAVMEMDKATYIPLNSIPAPMSDVSEVFLTPNEEIPTLYLVAGNPTSLEITDITGAPWPILERMSFSPFVKTEVAATEAKNSLWIIAQQNVGEAVLSVYLRDLDTVLSVRVVSDGKHYHRNKTLKVMRLGVNAKISRNTVQEAEEAGMAKDEDLMSASYGIRPNGFVTLVASSDAVVAWQKGEELIVYSSLALMMPHPTRIKTGIANGWTAYRVPNTTRLRFTNETGNVVSVSLQPKPFSAQLEVGHER